MTPEGIKRICQEIVEKYGIGYSDYHEERKGGEIKFITLTLKWLVDSQERKAGMPVPRTRGLASMNGIY